ncbi:MAG: hypothetical protein B7Y52_00175 [Sulfurovum sp. 28-43-6]|nr:MAG: hypothetical protein B7Y63_03205 [Sulfurovum sp. 35-42-20]OYY57724.1 MAG: hypothetical protein B7Y52_00175 [Sulfurovum sp. 28-43-6]OYZ25007.1 MAG: hypothetical protein B7Y23_07385 [Sulfurovum sp. 16-42-52]OYZ49650.1 MAG: hypothetical protein B7Y13_03815 [Sulfurovum sp. 24-42-9]OZA44918.1 MAG: hypothetical protein B7X80_06510 [Sulfurovum sp. 17-42-90]OZA59800.1 MAG: hypothetical protein B7X69_06565 [Sulfurovum sp. 39-42-12]
MKPAEYAQEIGISRQAVYAKIKRGILTTKSVEGKLYIVVDTPSKEQPAKATTEPKVQEKSVLASKATPLVSSPEAKDYKALLQAKDETIAVLKGTVKDLKKSNKQISSTLRGEINLLKDAFHEMRKLYANQLEHKRSNTEPIEVVFEEAENKESSKQWVGIKKFLKQQHITTEKEKEHTTKVLKKAYKSGDERLKKVDGKLKVNTTENFRDLLR